MLLVAGCGMGTGEGDEDAVAEQVQALTAAPGRIEAEAYNTGGEGVGYHTNHGDWGTAHPRPDSVDTGADASASGGYAIGWIEVGHWFAYDVSVATAGKYTVSPRVWSQWNPGKLRVEVDGVNVTGTMTFAASSSWVSTAPSAQFTLSAGTHRLKVVMEEKNFNFDALDVALVQADAPSATFLRGVDLGGSYASAVTVSGRSFVSETDAKRGGLSITTTSGGQPSAWQTSIANSTFSPAVTDTGLGKLLNNHVSATNSGIKLAQAACNGTYSVYTYHLENNTSNWRSFQIKVQGATHDTVSLAQNRWRKYGPYNATVSNATNGCNGTLNVELVRITRDASIMGLEIWRNGSTGSLPSIGGTTPPPGVSCGGTNSAFVPSGYVMTFCDEFSGTTLDRTKWKTRYIYNNETQDYLNDEQQRYRDNNNHVFENGVLKLTARKYDDPSRPKYESGMIRSTYTQRYGYYEARVRFPAGKGVWPAFWLNPDFGPNGTTDWPPEIDILEYVINEGSETTDMVHMNVLGSAAVQGGAYLFTHPNFDREYFYYRNPAGSLAGQWHVFGLVWDANTATVYLNGTKIVTYDYKWKHDNGTLAPPAHVLLNLAIGGSWAGANGVDDNKFPQSFDVDYVRVYRAP